MKTFILIFLLALATTACSSQRTATRSQITLNQEPPYTKTDNVQPAVDEQEEEDPEKQKNYGVTLMMLMVSVAVLLGSL